jgi:hypothetical protein
VPIVIDNFLKDPVAVRNSVLSAGFGTWRPNKGKSGADYYDGIGFYGDHAPIIETIYKRVGVIGYPNSMCFRVTNETTEKGVIHSDAAAGDTTCFLYLSSHPDKYGTAFYRKSGDDWVEEEFVRGQFNRIVVFKSQYYHCRFPLNGIGNDEITGRLVWVGHFKDGALQ